jgi:hypothetical protein
MKAAKLRKGAPRYRAEDDALGVFPSGLPESDRGRWAELTVAQRANAAKRLRAFRAWQSGNQSLNDAVAASGLSLSRFYRLAAAWKATPSLAALGVFRGSGAARERLDPEVIGALQAVVKDVVMLNDGAPVSQLVRIMVERSGVEEKKLPGALRLREIVENERRRVAATGEAGHTVMFDCSAINLPQADGRPHVMFVLVDKGTRLILGAAVGPSADATDGYARVAADVRARTSNDLANVPWSLRASQIYLTAGLDVAAAENIVLNLREAGVRTVQLKRVPRRYGGYFRQVIGDRIGRIAITPARTEQGAATPDNGDMRPWTESEAMAAVAHAVDEHNAGVLQDLPDGAGSRMPDDLDKTLTLLANVI